MVAPAVPEQAQIRGQRLEADARANPATKRLMFRVKEAIKIGLSQMPHKTLLS